MAAPKVVSKVKAAPAAERKKKQEGLQRYKMWKLPPVPLGSSHDATTA
jgi:hypothetical protein